MTREVGGCRTCRAGLEGFQLAFEFSLPIQQLAKLVDDFVALGREQMADLAKAHLLVNDVRSGSGTGYRLDAADAGSDATFTEDLEQADVASAADVCAATQLGRELAHAQHAHFVAVLFAKQRHGAEFDGLVIAHVADFSFCIGADPVVDQILDAAQLVGGDWLEMREIETQAIRRDQRTLLRDVLAQHLAQGGMQQMGRRMIEHDGLASIHIDGSFDGTAGNERRGPLPAPDMTVEGTTELERVADDETSGGCNQHTRITDLATRFGVERRAVEDDDAFLAIGH